MLSITQRDESKAYIQNAQDEEYIVRIRDDYEYVANALNIIVYTKHWRRFGINTREAQSAVMVNPSKRANLMRQVADVARSHGFIGETLSSRNSSVFISGTDFRYKPVLRFGNNATMPYGKGGIPIFNAIGEHDFFYRHVTAGQSADDPLNIGIINAGHVETQDFKISLEQHFRRLGFPHVKVGSINAADSSRLELEKAIARYAKYHLHALIALIPDSGSDDEDDWTPYYDFKSLMMQNGIANQVIDPATISDPSKFQYVMPNIVMGLATKMGNIPYVLAYPTDDADFVVGIDIARKRRKGGGSLNTAASAQVYSSSGQFLQSYVLDAQLEGETVPRNILQSLFPFEVFEGKRVIVHRDGIFRGDEANIIREYLTQMGATAYLVEVIKSGAPRIYNLEGKSVSEAPIATALLLNEMEAFLISTSFPKAMPQPLHIRTQEPFTIHQALNSVLSLSLMHHGSLRKPRAPVTIHYSDKIAYLGLRGVKPPNGYGVSLYWL